MKYRCRIEVEIEGKDLGHAAAELELIIGYATWKRLQAQIVRVELVESNEGAWIGYERK